MKKLILGSIVTALLLNSAVGVGASFAAGEQFRNAGIIAYKAKNYKSAVQYLEKALAAGDGSPDCYIYLNQAIGKSDFGEEVVRQADGGSSDDCWAGCKKKQCHSDCRTFFNGWIFQALFRFANDDTSRKSKPMPQRE
ncbi:MAG: hypothetical protein R3D26_05240 [Cyanobacteriota/Melainabacteria group bacterium]